MQRIFSIAPTLAISLLCACVGPTISHYQLSSLNKGMSVEHVQAVLKQEPRGMQTANIDSRSFDVSRYLLNNGMQNDLYYIAYEKGKLVYWGYASDFRRHPDMTMTKLIDSVVLKFEPIR